MRTLPTVVQEYGFELCPSNYWAATNCRALSFVVSFTQVQIKTFHGHKECQEEQQLFLVYLCKNFNTATVIKL